MSKNIDTSTANDLKACPLPRRLAAMLYDGLLLVATVMFAAALVVIPLGALDTEVGTGNPFFQLYLLLVIWGYFAICWRGGATLGMKAWRIKIKAPQGRISWSRSLLRFGVALISMLVFGLGFWWSLFHPRRATWHDLASDTQLVVYPRAKK